MQFHFSVDLVLILGTAWLIQSRFGSGARKFTWRWSIPATGVLLIIADWLYFYALSLPDTQISILSLLRRCSCVVTFAVGSFCFRDKNIKVKAAGARGDPRRSRHAGAGEITRPEAPSRGRVSGGLNGQTMTGFRSARSVRALSARRGRDAF